MNKKILLIAGLVILSQPVQADTFLLPGGDVHASHALGQVKVIHDECGYHITRKGVAYRIQSHNVDKSIRDLTSAQLLKAIGKIYFTITGDCEENFSINAHVRGPGGMHRFRSPEANARREREKSDRYIEKAAKASKRAADLEDSIADKHEKRAEEAAAVYKKEYAAMTSSRGRAEGDKSAAELYEDILTNKHKG
jgi:Mg-chelatase subunit ChlI